MTPARLSDEDEILAAELALELLEGADRTAAEARAAGDVRFGQAVDRWRLWLADLPDAVEPDPALWTRVQAALAANDGAANDDDIAPSTPLRPRYRWWGGIAALAAALLLLIVWRQPAPMPTGPAGAQHGAPPLVAMLADPARAGTVAVSYDPATRRLTATPHGLVAGQGRSAQLWVIADGAPPRPLGIIDAASAVIELPEPLARSVRPAVVLAVSLEPLGGSPTGLPTGPVVASGKINRA